MPYSESPNNPSGIGPTEDDVSLLWLKDSGDTQQAVALLEDHASEEGLGQIFSGRSIEQMFNTPGLPPHGDPRTPDIIITPNVGVIYTTSNKKQEEHGGFSHDDTNVMLLISNPGLPSRTISTSVETKQVAPTILNMLGLDPLLLQAVAIEGTQVLPE